jgi:hypothetical protein
MLGRLEWCGKSERSRIRLVLEANPAVQAPAQAAALASMLLAAATLQADA